jgi:hypothetical protein
MEDDYNASFSWAFYFGEGVCEARKMAPILSFEDSLWK